MQAERQIAIARTKARTKVALLARRLFAQSIAENPAELLNALCADRLHPHGGGKVIHAAAFDQPVDPKAHRGCKNDRLIAPVQIPRKRTACHLCKAQINLLPMQLHRKSLIAHAPVKYVAAARDAALHLLFKRRITLAHAGIAADLRAVKRGQRE